MVITVIFNFCDTSSVHHTLPLTWEFSGGPGNNEYCLLFRNVVTGGTYLLLSSHQEKQAFQEKTQSFGK